MIWNIKNKDNEKYTDEKYEFKNNIKEVLFRIFKLDINKLEKDKLNIMKYIKRPFGREYFVNLLNSEILLNRDVKLYIEESFDFFSYIIFNILLILLHIEESDNITKCAMKLINFGLYIKAMKNKKEYFLCDDLYIKIYNIYNTYNTYNAL